MALTTYVEQCTARLAQAARHVQKQKASIIDDWTVFTTCLNLIQAAGKAMSYKGETMSVFTYIHW